MKMPGSRFKNAPIETKLQLINLATTSLALLLIFIFLLANEFLFYRQNLRDNLTVQAKMIGINSTSAVVFRDQKAADETLSALQASAEIIRAVIYLPDDTLFARFERSARLENFKTLGWLKHIGLSYFNARLDLQEEIFFQDEKIGRLVIEADMQGLYQTLLGYAAITLLAALVALVLAGLLLQRLKSTITTPLSRLRDLMYKVSGDRDYSLRSPVDSNDEVGALARCFNEMLEEIQGRDSCLKDELSERKRAEQRLDILAYYDSLTNLPNRHHFDERIAKNIGKAKRVEDRFGLMFIDLDNFKIINDTLGHNIGDLLLIGVGERLSHVLRGKDFVFRLGGDEFAVILEDVFEREQAGLVAKKVIETLSTVFLLKEHRAYIGASIGISFYPADAADAFTLLRQADAAMYHAKDRGRNTFQCYLPKMNDKAMNRHNTGNDLRLALERDEFVLEYQPQFDLAAEKINGVEALLRWRHPDLGIINPSEFIHIAEETGLIVPIGEWVLRTACAQAAIWQAEHTESPSMAVNLSGRQFKDDSLVEKVLQILSQTGLNPQLLELELTESSLMDNSDANMEKLMRLRAAGINLSIDDFGTGYSSMSYLKRLPISTLKIDRSFVDGIPENSEDVAITTAIIALGHSLNMGLIAEGVETQAQADFMKNNGCTHVQGYFFSRPLPAWRLSELLQADSVARRAQ